MQEVSLRYPLFAIQSKGKSNIFANKFYKQAFFVVENGFSCDKPYFPLMALRSAACPK